MIEWSLVGGGGLMLSALALVSCSHTSQPSATPADVSMASATETTAGAADTRAKLLRAQGEAEARVTARTEDDKVARQKLQEAKGEQNPPPAQKDVLELEQRRQNYTAASLQTALDQLEAAKARVAKFDAELAAHEAAAAAREGEKVAAQRVAALRDQEKRDKGLESQAAQAAASVKDLDQRRDAAMLAQGRAIATSDEAARRARNSAAAMRQAAEDLKALTDKRVADANLTLDSTRIDAAKADAAAADSKVNVAKEDQKRAGSAPVDTTPPKTLTPKEQQDVEFATGGRLTYGLSVSAFEFNAKRPDDQPARFRHYQANLELVPPQLGFQFTYEPPGSGWRVKKKDGTDFQLVSVGGMVLVQVDNRTLAQGSIAVGGTLGFFDNVLGLGVAVDLYRGIPTQGADGKAGSATADTGFLAWAFIPHGELTPEDVSVVLTFGLQPIVDALSGVAK